LEYGTRVDDGRGGDIVATRAAAEPDENNQRRVIQLVTHVSRFAEMKKIRGISATVSAADGADLSAITELNANMLQVGDRSTLVVTARHSEADGEVTLTPVAGIISGVGESLTVTSEMKTGDRREYAFDMAATYSHNDPAVNMTAGISSGTTYRAMFRLPGTDMPALAEVSAALLKISSQAAATATNLSIAIFPEYLISEALAAASAEYWAEMTDLLATYGASLDASAWASGWNTIDILAAAQAVSAMPGWLRGTDMVVLIGQTVVGDTGGYISMDVSNPPYTEITHTGGILEKYILASKSTSCGDTAMTDGTDYLSPVLFWDMAGAWSVGVHITALSENNEITVSGGVI
jgi:hypothetical protein